MQRGLMTHQEVAQGLAEAAEFEQRLKPTPPEPIDESLWSRAGGKVGNVPGMPAKEVPKATRAINAMVKAAADAKAAFSSYKKDPENLSPVELYKALGKVLNGAGLVRSAIWRSGSLPKDLPDYSDPAVGPEPWHEEVELAESAISARDKATKAAMTEIKRYANQSNKTLTPTMVKQMETFISQAIATAMMYHGVK